MIVVSDTTPLISLLKIERLDLLKKLFENVLIPQAVYEEHELTSDEVKMVFRVCREQVDILDRGIIRCCWICWRIRFLNGYQLWFY